MGKRGIRMEAGAKLGDLDRNVGESRRVCWVSLISGAKRKANDHSKNFCLRMFGPVLGLKKLRLWVPLLRPREFRGPE